MASSFRTNLISLMVLGVAISLWSANLHPAQKKPPAVATSSATKSPEPISLDEWREIAMTEGIKFRLPGEPEYSTDQLGSDQEPITKRALSNYQGQQISAGWDKIPGKLHEGPSMEAGLRRIMRGKKLLSKQAVRFADLTGFDLTLERQQTHYNSSYREEDSRGKFIAIRLLDGHDRLFRLEATADDLALAQANLDRLCASFQLVKPR